MAYYILFFIGATTLWISVKSNDEVHRLALATAAVFPLSWGYFSSPVLFQCISAIAIVSAYQIYISSS